MINSLKKRLFNPYIRHIYTSYKHPKTKIQFSVFKFFLRFGIKDPVPKPEILEYPSFKKSVFKNRVSNTQFFVLLTCNFNILHKFIFGTIF